MTKKSNSPRRRNPSPKKNAPKSPSTISKSRKGSSISKNLLSYLENGPIPFDEDTRMEGNLDEDGFPCADLNIATELSLESENLKIAEKIYEEDDIQIAIEQSLHSNDSEEARFQKAIELSLQPNEEKELDQLFLDKFPTYEFWNNFFDCPFWNQAISHLNKALTRYQLEMIDKRSQQLSYCGNMQELLDYMKETGKYSMKPSEVRKWLTTNGAHLLPSRFATSTTTKKREFEIDHIIAVEFGGYDHPYNYFLMDKSVNNHFRQYMTPAKLAYIGKDASKTASNFAKWVKSRVQAQFDLNQFDQVRITLS